jgi:outer membrane lipoprotein-sorting protein
MRKHKKVFLIALLTIVFTSLVSAQTAKEIIKKADDLVRGISSESLIKMTIVRPDWERTIEMQSWALGTDYSLTLITSPVRDKGTTFLKRKNEIWNWVPSIGRSIKLPLFMMMQSWMGSDFINDDLVKESSILDDYEHEIISEETLDNQEVWKIKLTPKPDAAVVWGGVIVCITGKDFHQLKTEYYDEDDFLVNTMLASDVKVFDGRRIPSKMEMIPADKPGQKTQFEYLDLKFNTDLKPTFFSTQNMKRKGQ